MAASPIPLVPLFSGVHDEQRTRVEHVAAEFTRLFGHKPCYIARAPGRVNLIGEHIDYALFGVFPAAIERDILIACAPRPGDTTGRIVAENIDAKWHMNIDKTQLRWESYVKAGYYGVLECFFNNDSGLPVGFNMLVTGTVPSGSGLSSSAALVVASTLTFLVMNGKLHELTKGALVEMAMENEKRVGVNSGGMDQAASVISNAQAALYVTFHPRLAAEPIPLPVTSPRVVFVCANSLVVADKVVSAKFRYNLRVVETLVAARVLARRMRVTVGKTERVTLKQVVDRFLGVPEGETVNPSRLRQGLDRVLEEVEGLRQCDSNDPFEDTGLTLDEMVELSGLTHKEFHEIYFSWVDVEATHFQLYKRARHVLSESARVLDFREICLRSSPFPDTAAQLGRLMNESQTSCARLYECSCPELDELTRLACAAGAFGSRLTGAGWGGCTVSLVAEDKVEDFIAQIARNYEPYRGLTTEELHEVIFATKPSSGACVYQV